MMMTMMMVMMTMMMTMMMVMMMTMVTMMVVMIMIMIMMTMMMMGPGDDGCPLAPLLSSSHLSVLLDMRSSSLQMDRCLLSCRPDRGMEHLASPLVTIATGSHALRHPGETSGGQRRRCFDPAFFMEQARRSIAGPGILLVKESRILVSLVCVCVCVCSESGINAEASNEPHFDINDSSAAPSPESGINEPNATRLLDA